MSEVVGSPPWPSFKRVIIFAQRPKSLFHRSSWRKQGSRHKISASKEAEMHVVFVTTEVAPWSKVGGLADVLGALPIALAGQGISVMTVSPRYSAYEGVQPTDVHVPLDLPLEALNTLQATLAEQGSQSELELLLNQEAATQPPPPSAAAGQPIDPSFTHAQLYLTHEDGVSRVFVDHPLLRLSDIYGPSPMSTVKAGEQQSLTYMEAGQHTDLDVRYNILCQAALAAPVLLQDQEQIESPVVFVANDWPTALLSVRLLYAIQGMELPKTPAAPEPSGSDLQDLQHLLKLRLADAVTAFCIHNMAYQGVFPGSVFDRLCLPETAFPSLSMQSDWHAVLASSTANVPTAAAETASMPEGQTNIEAIAPSSSSSNSSSATIPRQGDINLMRGGLLTSDGICTVSPGYAKELKGNGPMGCGLGDIINKRGIRGIMNGIDTREWNPEHDVRLPEQGRYTAADTAAGKAHMKRLLQQRLGLDIDPDAPVVAFVGRLTQQKGVDLILAAAPALLVPPLAPKPSALPPLIAAVPTEDNNSKVEGDDGVSRGAPEFATESSETAARGRKRSKSKERSTPKSNTRSSSTGTLTRKSPSPRNRTQTLVTNASTPTQLQVLGPRDPSNPHPCQLVLLGTGEPWMEAALKGLEHSFPGQASGITQFSEELAHWILAAADFVLVPSRFEPCGLVAQCGVRYGAVPIVTAVGGLRDLVTADVGYCIPPISEGGVQRQDVQRLVATIKVACEEWGGPGYRAMQRRGMDMDLSWKQPAEEWKEFLNELVESKKE